MPFYRIADVLWLLQPEHPFIKEMLRPYLAEGNSEAREIILPDDRKEPEWDALLRRVNRVLLDDYDGMVFHGAALVYRGKAYLFTAPSGTGKTTHVKLWLQEYPDQAWILNGDKPFVRIFDSEIRVYGGPWQGKERMGVNASCPLGGVYLLRRGEENRVEPASPMEALKAMLPGVLLPKDLPGRLKLIQLLEAICSRVPVSILTCNMEPQAAAIVREHIHKGEEHED